MGVVYRARHPTLGIEVALKTMRFEAAHAGLAERFQREAQAVVRLNHPHIVRLYEAGHDGDVHFYTMALVPGGTLSRRRQEFQGDARRVATLMEMVARGVGHAHEAGIVHRDLKPGNILLNERAEPLVSDFGLAKFVEGDHELTVSGMVLGTAAYMAPEQASGHNSQVGTASDVWALGVILYELLTGGKPFPEPGTLKGMHALQTAEPKRPSSLNRQFDRALDTIVLKCLEKDPGRRYRTATELADDLGRWLRGEPILARPQPWPLRAWRKLRRRPLLLALALLACCAVPAWFAWQWHNDLEQQSHADPERQLQHIESQLENGLEVPLLDPAGTPRWFRWRTGESEAKLDAKDGICFINCRTWALAELLPAVKTIPFRLEATVKHDDGNESGMTGLYFCHSEAPAASGRHYFGTINFAERGSWTTGMARFDLFGWHEPTQVQDQSVGRAPIGPPMPFAPKAGKWRHLAVEVRANSVCVFFDGVRHGDYLYGKLDREGRYTMPQSRRWRHQPFPTTFRPGMAVGLVVFRSTAYFRSVTIRKLDN
jgi:hypothetical protein